jgi:prevent-host-death family protein
MPVVGIRQLARNASAIIHDVSKTGKPTVVTDRGKPVGVIYPFDEEDLEYYILANAPEYVARREQADRDLAEGKTFSLAEGLARLEAERANATSSKPDEARSA